MLGPRHSWSLALVLAASMGVVACGDDDDDTATGDGDADADGDGDGDADADADGDADGDGDGDGDADGDGDLCVDEPGPVVTPFHVSPDGTPEGDGSAEAPWDLATAFAHPAAVQPGDVIWLHGGTYAGGFDAALRGEDGARITVTSAPGEWAIVDLAAGGGAAFQGAFATYRDFEITDTDPNRWNPDPGSNFARGGVDAFGEQLELVHLVIHDTAGCGFWTPARDLVLYGNLIFNNGWDAPDRAHGHGVYMQNAEGTKHIEDNLVWSSFSYGCHAYTEGGSIQGFDLVGNVFFNAGAGSPGADRWTPNCLIGGLQPADRITLTENVSWHRDPDARALQLGYSGDFDNGAVTLTDNILVGRTLFDAPWTTITMTGNAMYGALEGVDPAAFPDNVVGPPPADGATVRIRPSRYTPRRAHVAVLNWARAATVSIDVSAVLPRGATYELRDAQSWSGPPVLSGTWDGTPLVVPMDGQPAQPIGADGAIEASEVTTPDFAAFVLLGGPCAE